MIDALPLLLGPEGYQISRSVRLRSSASGYLTRTISAASTSTTICTWSGWAKRGALGIARATIAYHGNAGGSGGMIDLEFASDTLRCFHDGTNFIQTSAVYRDPSAWYHVVLVYDSTQATASNRLKLFVNGLQVTAFSTASYPALNQAINAGSTNVQNLGLVGAHQFDGYLTEINFIDGQALTPSSFGETDAVTGVWKPKKYAGTYGTNGFYLNFSDPSAATAAAIGKDSSGNGNNWTPNNISVAGGFTYDSMIDVPTPYADGGNGRGNYAVLNAASIGADATLSAGNLQIAYGSGSTIRGTMATFGMSSGKWYWEATITASSLAATGAMIGIANTPSASAVPEYPGYSANGWSYHGNNGSKYTNASGSSYGATYGVNDVIGVSFDADTRELIFYKNGTSQGVAFTGLAAGDYFPAVGDGSAGNTFTAAFNFGQRPFAYTPPTGFKALNTQNLPEPTIKKGGSYFDVVLYTGDAVQDRAVTGFGFDLDLAWIKSRNNAGSHVLVNRVVGGDKQLFSNLTNAEQTNADVTNGFTTGGILLGDNVSGTGSTNQNTYTYALWGWKEGATQGFDIVTYTGNGANRTVAHNLGVAPSMMIVKNRNSGAGYNWRVYHGSLASAANYLEINTTAVSQSDTTVWNNTAPTSSVFSLGTSANVNANADTYVAYLFSEVAGFSRFGSYTGNGSTDGPFVFTGFRPRWIMIKNIQDSTTAWSIWDTSRSPSNLGDQRLGANASAAESSLAQFDLLSNGFKLRSSNSNNASGQTIIFAAFAEHPFKLSLAR